MCLKQYLFATKKFKFYLKKNIYIFVDLKLCDGSTSNILSQDLRFE